MAIVNTEKKLKKKAAALTAIAGSALLLVGAGCAAPAADKDGDNDANVPAGADTNTAGAPVSMGNYKDGSYTAVGHYTSPAGPETINVTLTLKNNLITDADVKPQATNRKSVFMQNAFVSGYKPLVVGKNIDEVMLSGNISGSSLTLKGFNDAVAQVKALASK